MIPGSFVLKLQVIEPIEKLLVMPPFPGIDNKTFAERIMYRSTKKVRKVRIVKHHRL